MVATFAVGNEMSNNRIGGSRDAELEWLGTRFVRLEREPRSTG
jgi:hypothetical protein